MLQIRRGDERGHFDHGWVNTYHTFSFGHYEDPDHMGFRTLRVMNEDRVQPGKGFGTHPHDNMEIISYVLEGALVHKDNMGYASILRAGDLQRISAGTGVLHSEFNASSEQLVHFYQVWIMPAKPDVEPSYEELAAPRTPDTGRLRMVASPDGGNGALTINQDVTIYLAALDGSQAVAHVPASGRHVWLQVMRGSARVNDELLHAGDGAAASDEPRLSITGAQDGSEVMLFDLG